ncbi:tetratricopeptide repeat protein [Flavihumibacter sp. R14]|nr:tetratricopeptide repeat protein [Flavihumibacter soli]
MRKIVLFLLLFLPVVSAFAQQNDDALAAQFFQSGEYEKAAVIYQKLFSQTKNPAYYDPLFTSLLNLKRYEEAEQLVRRQMKSSPQNYIYSIDMGRVLQDRGEKTQATTLYNQLLSNLPNTEAAIRDLATAFYRADAYDYSIKTFVQGRKHLGNENAFGFDLIGLYRFRKDKVMLIQEYLLLLETTPEALTQAQNVLANVFEDAADYELLESALIRRLQKDPQNIAYSELLTWQFIQQKDFDMALRQTLALDRRLKEEGERVLALSRIFTTNKAFAQAIEALNYLIAKGGDSRYYIPAKIDLLNVKSQMLTSGNFNHEELLQLEKDYLFLLDEFGRNSGTAFAVRQLASLQAFYLRQPADAAGILENLLQVPGLPPSTVGPAKLELGDIYILTGEVWEAALIYGQVEKQFANEPAGQEAKFKNARLSYFQGDFMWAKAQLDVLKASTSQLYANDALNLRLLISDNLQNETDTAALRIYSRADMLIFKNQPENALRTLDSIDKQFLSNSLADDILMAKAKIFVKQNDLNAAISQLQKIVKDYSFDLWADDAMFILAEVYETRLNDTEKAKGLYQKIITDFPGSLYVIEARKRFRSLRGDKIG